MEPDLPPAPRPVCARCDAPIERDQYRGFSPLLQDWVHGDRSDCREDFLDEITRERGL